MKYIILFLQLSTCLPLFSQPTIQWHKSYGGNYFDEANSVRQTTDGGYIVAGSSASSNLFGQHGGDDMWILKLAADGALKWRKFLGGTGNDVARCIRQTADGGYFVVGTTESNNYDVSGNHGGFYDGWFVKLDNNGNIQWQKTLGGSGWDEIVSAEQTTDKGYILAGRSENADGDVSYNYGFTDFWVVKLSETGNIEWEKSYGGGLEDAARSVKQTSDGGYVVAGESSSTDGQVTGQHGDGDFWVIKLSSTGTLEWESALGGSGWDVGSDVIQTADGGYAVFGYDGSGDGDITDPKGQFDYWVVALDGQGKIKWQKTLGGSIPDWGESIIEVNDGGLILAGTASSSDQDLQGNTQSAQFWLVKLNKHGQLVWEQTYGGSQSDFCYSHCLTADGGMIAVGYSWSVDGDATGLINQGYNDFWIVKLSSETVDVHETPKSLAPEIEISPNPVQQMVRLTILDEQANPIDISVYDLLGAKIHKQAIINGSEMDLSFLAPGIYVINAVNEKGKVFTRKLEKL